MDPWIHGSAAGAAARAAARAVAGAAASAATVFTYYVIIGGALRALLSKFKKEVDLRCSRVLGFDVDSEGSSRRFFQGFSKVLQEDPPRCP